MAAGGAGRILEGMVEQTKFRTCRKCAGIPLEPCPDCEYVTADEVARHLAETNDPVRIKSYMSDLFRACEIAAEKTLR